MLLTNGKIYDSIGSIEKATDFFLKIYRWKYGEVAEENLVEELNRIASRHGGFEGAKQALTYVLSNLSTADYKEAADAGAITDYGDFIVEAEV